MVQVVFTISNGSVAGARFEGPAYVAQAGEFVYQAPDAQVDLNALLHAAALNGSTVTVSSAKYAAYIALRLTDADTPRVVEDLIDVLIAKGAAALSDLPAATQGRYNAKKTARAAYLAA